MEQISLVCPFESMLNSSTISALLSAHGRPVQKCFLLLVQPFCVSALAGGQLLYCQRPSDRNRRRKPANTVQGVPIVQKWLFRRSRCRGIVHLRMSSESLGTEPEMRDISLFVYLISTYFAKLGRHDFIVKFIMKILVLTSYF